MSWDLEGWALPYIGGYQVPVNRPHSFMPILHPIAPLWSPHPMIPFSTVVSNFTCCKFLHASGAFWEIFKFFSNLNKKFLLEITLLHTKWPPFWGSTSKKIPCFWSPHRMTLFFQQNLTPNAPHFCSPVGTCTVTFIFEFPPPPLGVTQGWK